VPETRFAFTQRRLRALALRDVEQCTDGALEPAVGIAHCQSALPYPHPAPILVAHAELEIEFGSVAGQERLQRGMEARRVVGMDAAEPPFPGWLALVRLVAEHLVGAGRTVGVFGDQVGFVDRAVKGGDRQPVALLAVAQRRGRPPLIGDVEQRADPAKGTPRGVERHLPADEHDSMGGIIEAPDAALCFIAPVFRGFVGCAVFPSDPLAVLGMDHA
jgi:hypothetical protein